MADKVVSERDQYEYTFGSIKYTNVSLGSEELNKKGAEGWRVVPGMLFDNVFVLMERVIK